MLLHVGRNIMGPVIVPPCLSWCPLLFRSWWGIRRDCGVRRLLCAEGSLFCVILMSCGYRVIRCSTLVLVRTMLHRLLFHCLLPWLVSFPPALTTCALLLNVNGGLLFCSFLFLVRCSSWFGPDDFLIISVSVWFVRPTLYGSVTTSLVIVLPSSVFSSDRLEVFLVLGTFVSVISVLFDVGPCNECSAAM